MAGIGDILGPVLGFVGANQSANANKDIAEAQVRSARENRDFDMSRLNEGMARYLAMQLGPDEAERYLRATLPGDQLTALFRDPDAQARRAAAQQELAAIERQLAPYRTRGEPFPTGGGGLNQVASRGRGAGRGPDRFARERAREAGIDIDALLRRSKELDQTLAGEGPDNPGGIDLGSFRSLGPGVWQEYNDLTARAESEGNDALGRHDADTARLLRGSRAIEGMARGYGQQERERINRDADRALTGINRLTESRLMGRGLGASTVLSSAFRGNTQANREGRENALGSLGDRQIGLTTGLAGQTLNMDAGRSQNRMGLMLANQDRGLGYRQGAVNFRANALGGSQTNPWLSRSTQQYFPGVSPSGASGQSWGSFLSGFGGQIAGGGFDLSGLSGLFSGGRGGGGGSGSVTYGSGLRRGFSQDPSTMFGTSAYP